MQPKFEYVPFMHYFFLNEVILKASYQAILNDVRRQSSVSILICLIDFNKILIRLFISLCACNCILLGSSNNRLRTTVKTMQYS